MRMARTIRARGAHLGACILRLALAIVLSILCNAAALANEDLAEASYRRGELAEAAALNQQISSVTDVSVISFPSLAGACSMRPSIRCLLPPGVIRAATHYGS